MVADAVDREHEQGEQDLVPQLGDAEDVDERLEHERVTSTRDQSSGVARDAFASYAANACVAVVATPSSGCDAAFAAAARLSAHRPSAGRGGRFGRGCRGGASAAAASASSPPAPSAFSRLTNFFLGLGNSNASPLRFCAVPPASVIFSWADLLYQPATTVSFFAARRRRGSSPAACRRGPGPLRSARRRRRSCRRRTARGPTGSRCGTGARSCRC